MNTKVSKWLPVLLMILLMVVSTICSCSKFYYQSPLTKFNHEEHIDSLFEQQKDCSFCHKLASIEKLIQQEGKYKVAPKLKKAATEIKLEGQCHSCHKDKATKVATATSNCGTCHEHLKSMKPDNHVSYWRRLHAVPASIDSNNCQNCHKAWYCESCHSQQKTAYSFRHSRTYKLKHSVEALVDPGSCGTCHRVDFCIDNDCSGSGSGRTGRLRMSSWSRWRTDSTSNTSKASWRGSRYGL